MSLITHQGSDDSFEKIKQWIALCSLHPNCKTPDDSVLPTRLIDVNIASSDVVLVEIDRKCGVYTCLSHPWGEEHPLTTTTKTIGDHKEMIRLEALPLTVRDAIEVTRRIGIRWLWVDALCIIQDSPVDWQTESSKMADIYSNSYITISATSSNCGSDGCFSKVQIRQQIEVPSGPGGQPLIGTYFREVSSVWGEECDCIRGRNNAGPFKMPLMARSWVFQERLLSPRVLHFGPDEMIWECMGSVMCECTQGYVRKPESKGIKMLFNNSITGAVSPRQSSVETWHELCRAYFTCRITYPEDRLPALSGLSRAFQKSNPDVGSYMAGLWSKELPNALLWFYGSKWGTLFEMMEKYYVGRHRGAPTWSWASLFGYTDELTLAFLLDNYNASNYPTSTTMLCGIVNVECKAEGLDAFGAVSVGKLTLESPGASAQLVRRETSLDSKGESSFPRKDPPSLFEKEKSQTDGPFLGRLADAMVTSAGVIAYFKDGHTKDEHEQRRHMWFMVDCWGADSSSAPSKENGIGDGDDIFCAILVRIKEANCNRCNNSYSRVSGLLLKKSETHLGCYERIGLFYAAEENFPDAETRIFTIV